LTVHPKKCILLAIKLIFYLKQMTQLTFFEPPIWSVTDLTHYVHDLLANDDNLQDVWVQGEVSNFSRPISGHLYFTLKDSACSLRCVMWKNAALRQKVIPREGDALEVHGSLNVYEAAGQYQLYADLIRPAGEGALYREFLRLKERLEAEGLFAPERKRPIPRWPHRIGIVTSPTGAALRDILHTLTRRYPLVEVILAPTQVQGDEAPAGIVAAIQALNRVAHPDVILVARGGGSIEDLWAFNDEGVARAMAASTAPVISGVGHETDFTIADFVSDLRAPTPTAAAELSTPDRADLLASLDDMSQRIARAMQSILNSQRWNLNRIESRLALRSPQTRIHSGRQRLDDLARRVEAAFAHRLQVQRIHLTGLDARLAALNPQSVLRRGYALVSLPDGRRVRSTRQVKPGDDLSIRVSDGQFAAQVQGTDPDKKPPD
jgi:exodeoxyribonuclease VII large subunit